MPRPTAKRVRQLMYDVAMRDGFKCNNKRASKHSALLVLDHKDNNPSNNKLDNLQILCQGCNTRKNPRGKGRRGMRVRDLLHRKHALVYVSERENEIEPESVKTQIQSRELAKNEICEPRFRSWLENMIDVMSSLLVTDVVNGGAEEVGCSQNTIRRYLDKLCSFMGEYEYFEDDGKRFVREKIARLPEPGGNINGNGEDHGSFPDEIIAGQN